MEITSLLALQGRTVEVETLHCRYQGTLVQITEEGIGLQTDHGWIDIPLDQVVAVREGETL